jgi:hypothetical protein
MRTIIILSFLFFLNLTLATSPAIYYTYDNVGNRTGRIIIAEESSQSKSARKNNSNNDTTDMQSESAADTHLLANVDVKIYPNPTAGLLHLKTNSNDVSMPLHYVLYGSGGNVLFDGVLNGGQAEVLLDISCYASSTYYLMLFIDTEKRVWKIIKQ